MATFIDALAQAAAAKRPHATGRLYARLSLTRRGDNLSIERQVELGRAWFKAHGFTRVVEYVEPPGHRSGADDVHRPQYKKLLAEIQPHDTLWCAAQARFTRDDDVAKVVKKLFKQHITVVFGERVLNPDDLTDLTRVRLDGVVNALESSNASQRAKDAYAGWKRAGAYYTRKLPPGLKAEGHGLYRKRVASREGVWKIGEWLVVGEKDTPPCRDGQGEFRGYLECVQAYYELYLREGLGARRAAQRLNQLGYYSRANGGVPRPVDESDPYQFRKLLDRYEGILDATLLRRVRAKLAERPVGAGRAYVQHDPPLLYRMLTCAYCGHRYVTAWSNQYHRHYFRHSHHACAHKHKYSAVKLNAQLFEYLQPLQALTRADREAIAREMVRLRQAHAPQVDPTAQRARLDRQILNLERQLVQGRIREESYDTLRAEVQAELDRLPAPAPQPEFTVAGLLSVIGELQRRIPEAQPRDLNPLLEQLFERISVRDGKLEFTPRAPYRGFWVSNGKL